MNFRNCKKNFNRALTRVGENMPECFMDKGYRGWIASYAATECNGLRSSGRVIRAGDGEENQGKKGATTDDITGRRR